MKYQLETIPVWDAFKAGGACPLCAMAAKLEEGYLDAALGASVMEPDTRVRVNAEGFCEKHFVRMLDMRNRLGLALITHTHMLEASGKLNAALDALEAKLERADKGRTRGEPEDAGRRPLPGLIRRIGSLLGTQRRALARAAGEAAGTAPYLSAARACAAEARRLSSTCHICGQIDNTMARYAETVCYLYAHDKEFPGVFGSCGPFCLPHFALLADAAARTRGAAPFLSALCAVQRAGMKRVADELEWFTLKFDYRNSDKPWGNSKDAPERAVNMLKGRVREGSDEA